MLEQRYIRHATPDEYEVFAIKRTSDQPQRHSIVTKAGAGVAPAAAPVGKAPEGSGKPAA